MLRHPGRRPPGRNGAGAGKSAKSLPTGAPGGPARRVQTPFRMAFAFVRPRALAACLIVFASASLSSAPLQAASRNVERYDVKVANSSMNVMTTDWFTASPTPLGPPLALSPK